MLELTPFNTRKMTKRNGTKFDDFYDVMDSFFTDSSLGLRNLNRDTFKIDIKEDEEFYTVIADVPGIKKSDLNLQYNEGLLTINIEREEEDNVEKGNYIHRERRYSSMQRRIQLKNIDEESIKAKLEEGVLIVKVEKLKKEDEQRYIEIE